MIEPTDEMVTAAAEVAEEEMIRRLGRDLGTIHRDDIIRAILKAGLAIVERDWCLERRGHVYHPLAKRQWPTGRGGSHPHFCVSCSDGETAGPGCGNCRSTGMDQTPWPSCGECAR